MKSIKSDFNDINKSRSISLEKSVRIRAVGQARLLPSQSESHWSHNDVVVEEVDAVGFLVLVMAAVVVVVVVVVVVAVVIRELTTNEVQR
ncbi:hypothetical protein BO70DRAFT_107863 [Aspergillus heteromorphus CBS 117.55]|uniref:Uncharacterized protein n=1 Tax=Aspergillus heteromorphus CBS 117.55 TaxID=1448321 RepID=A0A317VGR3_9EURO|nr:uncharacterized protein BO70DRAFT_107863 [Aspergillus heteromorphus CBS 117.55]PWY73554.1 hypothetical protein BO70DRAFT_107863 [Aspergillus heteromorphus CBS 117.55]